MEQENENTNLFFSIFNYIIGKDDNEKEKKDKNVYHVDNIEPFINTFKNELFIVRLIFFYILITFDSKKFIIKKFMDTIAVFFYVYYIYFNWMNISYFYLIPINFIFKFFYQKNIIIFI